MNQPFSTSRPRPRAEHCTQNQSQRKAALRPLPEPRPLLRSAGCAHPPLSHRRRLAGFTSAARIARSPRLLGGPQGLWNHLGESAWGEALSFPTAHADTPRPFPLTSPAPCAWGRGHSCPSALPAASRVRAPCAPAGPRLQAPDSARPPSALDIRPGPGPLRARARLRKAQPELETGLGGTSPDGPQTPHTGQRESGV